MTKRHIYTFGAFQLDAQQRILLREGERLPLHPKTLMTLLVLVESGGAVVTKDDLLAKIWPDTFVEESSLTKNISMLRKALRNGHDPAPYIETIPTIGYRFVAPVCIVANDKAMLPGWQKHRSRFTQASCWPRRWLWGLGLAGLLGGLLVAAHS